VGSSRTPRPLVGPYGRALNIAGRGGRWSASRWKTAAFGWLALAVLATAVAGAVGAREMKQWAIANGDSRRAEQILDEADFKLPARESVLIQSPTNTIDDPAFVRAVANVVRSLFGEPNVLDVVSPYERPSWTRGSRGMCSGPS
jgi:RND superfamily putative drug exporter